MKSLICVLGLVLSHSIWAKDSAMLKNKNKTPTGRDYNSALKNGTALPNNNVLRPRSERKHRPSRRGLVRRNPYKKVIEGDSKNDNKFIINEFYKLSKIENRNELAEIQDILQESEKKSEIIRIEKKNEIAKLENDITMRLRSKLEKKVEAPGDVKGLTADIAEASTQQEYEKALEEVLSTLSQDILYKSYSAPMLTKGTASSEDAERTSEVMNDTSSEEDKSGTKAAGK